MQLYVQYSETTGVDGWIRLDSLPRREITPSHTGKSTLEIVFCDEIDSACPECKRLWRELGQVVQQNFRLEEQLRRAADRRDHDSVAVLSSKLARLPREQLMLQRSLAEHERAAHAQKVAFKFEWVKLV